MASTYLDLIVRKRDGETWSKEEIDRVVRALVDREIPDHQIGALLMAVYLRGLDPRETVDLTMAMVRSGDTIDLSAIEGFKADKHSTGGVGDKVTLVLGPLVAAAGVKFPKLSGRGLAHTGGTLDKLESIPGMRVDLAADEVIRQVAAIGLAICGQTAELVPADRLIYALRDQTATIDSVPLIASSVMSKKIAAGADGILLDVKCGRGAFMKTLDAARALARQMVDIGEAAGRRTRALITSMDQPLGCAVGNALEVREAIDTLHGLGPDDLTDEVLALGAEILMMAGLTHDPQEGTEALRPKLLDGSAAERLRQMVRWQGGDQRVIDDTSLLPSAERVVEVRSRAEGYLMSIDALAIGGVAMDLGAGRRSKDEPVAASAGVLLRTKAHGQRVRSGHVLAELHVPPDWDERAPLRALEERVRAACCLTPEPPQSTEEDAVLAVVA